MDSHRPCFDGVRFCGGAFWPLPGSDAGHPRRPHSAAEPALLPGSDPEAPADVERPRLGKASTLARFALIGVALAAVAGTFAYLGGWLTPNELTPFRFVDGFEQVNGVHAGFRRNHAKGVG